MKKIIFFAGLLPLLIILAGCPGPTPVYYKDIETARITPECADFKDDACGLFACLVENCWCESSPNAVLQEGSSVIQTDAEAIDAVSQYLQSTNEPFEKIESAAKLNNVFWNVFVIDAQNNERVFTIAADCTIIKTQCGV